MTDLAIVADIGGTNTRVALAKAGRVDAGSVRRYANAKASGLDVVLRRYMADTGTEAAAITGASAAGAGPMRNGAVQLTNLDWLISPELLRDTVGTSHVAVLNDLQAQGFAIGHAAPDHVTEIVAQPANPQSQTKLVVGVGTGFNAAPVFEGPEGRRVMPSESGHIGLPACADARVLRYMEDRFGFASVEEALSGRGISQVHEALHGATLDAPEIMANLAKGDAAARDTVQEVVHLLGAVVGDLALVFLPFGGIHLVGGVTGHIAPWLDSLGFRRAMQAKGRFGPFMQQFGVSVVTDDYAALAGCAAYLNQQR